MSLRALLRGSILYSIGNFLPRVGAFLMLPIYTAALAPGAFGQFSLLLSVAGVLGVVVRLGLDGALMRLHFDLEDRERRPLYSTVTVTTLSVACAVLLVVGVASAPFFEELFAGAPFWPLGPITLALTFLLAIGYVPLTFLRASQLPGRFVLLTAMSFFIGLAATITFLLVLDLGAAGAMLGQVLAAAVVAAATVGVFSRLGVAAPRRDHLRRSLTFGLPLVPHALSGWVLNVSDRWLIALLTAGGSAAAASAVGIYAFGYVIGQGVSLVAFSVNAAWVPFFYEQGETPAGPRILRAATTLSAIGLCVLAAGVGLLAPELVVLLGGDRWGPAARDAAKVTAVVAYASTLYGLYYMVVSAIFLVRRTALLPVLTILAGAVNVGLNVLLIPRIGIMGAAWATLAGYAVLAALTTWYAKRVYPVRLDVARLALVFVGTGGLLLASAVLTEPVDGTLVGAGLHLGLAASAALAGFVLGLGPLRELRAALGRPGSRYHGSPKEN